MLPSRLVRNALCCGFALLGSAPTQIELLAPRKATTPAPVPWSTAVVADFDGDGRPDLFLGVRAYKPRLYLQTAPGRFGDASVRVPASDEWVLVAAAGDLDGDGDQDVLALAQADLGTLRALLLRNVGSGAFAVVGLSVALPPRVAFDDMVLGDVDGDGDLDAVIAVRASPNLLFVNDGRGQFTAGSGLPADQDQTTSLALGDVDGDGDLDLLVGNGRPGVRGGHANRLYRNDGRGTFTDASANLPALLDNTEGVALVDLDRDGDLDAVVANKDDGGPAGAGRSRVLLNDGRGVFTDASATHLALDPDGAMAVAVVDVDGDGHTDIVFGGVTVAGVVYRNDGTGRFAPALARRLTQTGGRGERIVGVDLDGNGTADLVVSGWTLQVFFNLGRGEFEDATGEQRSPPQLGWLHHMCVFDADGDGDPDRFDQFGLALNRGDGVFSRTGSRVLTNENAFAWVAAADLENDGDVDVVWHGAIPHVLLNDGRGNLTEALGRLPNVQPRFGGAIALADVDGDGDRDLLLGTWAGALGTGQMELWLNDGTGQFSDATANLPRNAGDRTSALAVFDADGDSDLDVLVGNGGITSEQADRLFLNDGRGRFVDASAQLPPVLEYTKSIAVADIDGDGDLDVFLGMLPPATADFQNRLYLNDGRGTFTDVSLLRLPAAARDNLAPGTTFADLDGDGDADLCLAEGGSLVMCENDGRGFYTLRPLGVLDTGASIAAADVDGDGDLDLIGSRIVANARRHLHALDMARVGGTLRLHARHRAAGAPFPLLPFVAAGRMAQPLSLGTLGLLFLDPASLAPLAPLTMATSLVVTLALPNDPRLVGLTLHAQAAFLPPSVADWHLSGLVSEPILR